MVLDRPTLTGYLDRLEWSYTAVDDSTLACPRTTGDGTLPVFVRLGEHWLVASIVPFLSTRGRNSLELSRWLLRQNHDMYQSKFAYDDDGDVVLTLEMPTESLDFEEVRTALHGLVADAVRHRRTLREAAARR